MRHCDDISRLPAEQKTALRQRIKTENPEMHAVIAATNQCFPGARVEYVRLGEEEWGTTADPKDLFPAIPGPLYRPDKKGRKR